MSSTPAGLQNQLNHLKNEADRLYLSVNLGKTSMVFGMGGQWAARERWMYGDEKITVTNAYKYLGMTFTIKLCIDFVLSDVCKKGKKGVMEIQKAMGRLSSSDPMIFWKLFASQIEPMFTYAAEVWGLGNVDQIEKVQTYAMNRFLSVPLHASNKLLYGETGR